MLTSKRWVDVDLRGLRDLLADRGKSFAVLELIQNAWDEDGVTRVDVALSRVRGRTWALSVTDDAPNGFADLRDAYTLFAPSKKKPNPEKRGVFNMGEKLVLSLCSWVRIHTTTGMVTFDDRGRHQGPQNATEKGSVFVGELTLTLAEVAEITEKMRTLLPPIPTFFNGEQIAEPTPIHETQIALPTVLSNADGALTRTTRLTRFLVYEPLGASMLYEMGIPIVPIDLPWSVNIAQRVPLNMNRDNVTPAYLQKVRVAVLNLMSGQMDKEQATQPWSREAASDSDASSHAVHDVMTLRYGEKRVAFDPSDPEANKLAVTKGYTVVFGGSLTPGEWANVKRDETITPAGQVTPSPKPFSDDGTPLRMLQESERTSGIDWFCRVARHVAKGVLNVPDLVVRVANDPGWRFAGCYRKGELTVNVSRVGYAFFSATRLVDVLAFLIHEFAHHYAGDHLSEAYHDALTRVGAKLAVLVGSDSRVILLDSD